MADNKGCNVIESGHQKKYFPHKIPLLSAGESVGLMLCIVNQ